MQFEQFFASAIEVAIAIAGFSGIAAVLGQRREGKWSQADLARVSILVQASFIAILLSFLPLVLAGAGVSSPTIWRIGSGCFIAYIAFAIPLRRRAIRRIGSQDPTSYSLYLVNASIATAVALAILQVYNVLSLASGWPFVLTIVLEIVIALIAFVRLLQALWENSPA